LHASDNSSGVFASRQQGDGVRSSFALSKILTATNRKIFMTSPAVRNEIQIDHVCSAAICAEIGDRLRISLKGAPERLPQHMLMLVEQMARND
jgi:hypothetical protein